MSNVKLKSYLHQLIDETNDTFLLRKVGAYLQTLQKENDTKDWWATISVDEKKAIETGIHKFEKHKGIADRDVRKKIDNLLSKN